MNTDRFLTRVFDKQEKKMLYSEHFDPLAKHIYGDNYIGLNKEGIILASSHQFMGTTEDGIDLDFIPFGDRFIPMQCWGNVDCDKELVYESDIVNGFYRDIDMPTVKITRGVVRVVDGCFDVYQDNVFICELYDLKEFNIRGNIHQDPEVLEESK